MEYSQIIGSALGYKFAPDSSFFIHFEGTKLYIKESSVDIKNIGVINTQSTISEAAVSPNSKYVAIFLNKKSLIHIYKVDNCQPMAKIEDSQAGISSFFWAKNSLQLLVFSEYMYKVSIYNLTDGTMAFIKAPKFSTTKGCAFTSDGKFMALLEKHDCKDYLSIYYTTGWKVVNNYLVDLFDAVEVIWSPNNSYIVVWDNCVNYRLLVYCHVKGQVLKYEPYNFALGIKTVQFSNNSLFLAIGSFDQKIRLLNGLTWQEIGELDCSNANVPCEDITIYREEESSKNVNRMKIYEGSHYKVPTVKLVQNADKGYPNQGIGMLEFSDDDNYLACRNDNMPYTVWIWSISKLQVASIVTCQSPIKGLKWTKKSTTLSIVYGTDRILFWKPNGSIAECGFGFQHKKLNIQKMKWSGDGCKLLISDKTEFAYAELTAESIF